MYNLIFRCKVLPCRGYLDSLCMDCAELSMACMCSNRSCPCCWFSNSQLDDTESTCKYRRAKGVLAQLDGLCVEREG